MATLEVICLKKILLGGFFVLFVLVLGCTTEQQEEFSETTLTDDNMPDVQVQVSYDEEYQPPADTLNFENMKCVMTTPQGTTTMYFMGSKYKSVTAVAQGMVTMINDGQDVYMWQGMQGMKMPLAMMQGGQPGIGQLAQNAKSLSEARAEVQQQLTAAQTTMDCDNGVVSSGEFALPSDVQFQDLGALI